MRGWRGFLAGAIGLVMLQTVVANREANQRAAGLPGIALVSLRRLLDPTVPAFGASNPGWGDMGSGDFARRPTITTPDAVEGANRYYPNPSSPPVPVSPSTPPIR